MLYHRFLLLFFILFYYITLLFEVKLELKLAVVCNNDDGFYFSGLGGNDMALLGTCEIWLCFCA